MIYSRRKIRNIWAAITLLCTSVIFITLVRWVVVVPMDEGATEKLLKRDRDTALRTTTDLFQRLYLDMKESPIEADKVIESVDFLNSEHEVLNVNKFGTPTNDNVHKRLEYLIHLISSLRGVKGIGDTLLIFSHDFNDDEINRQIRSIDFCRVIQIFYPYSIQLFSNAFPGQDPRDCPAKPTKQQLETCKNKEFPDKYGNYRVASFTQIKHHWWWKMNYIFKVIMPKYALNRYIILLEEDHFLMPDSLHFLGQMIEMKESICMDCKIFCLGAYLKNYKKYRSDIAKVSIAPWFTSKHNMGMAISPDTWQEFWNCSEVFCTYDDYNWDWSLLNVGMKCLSMRPRVIFANSPRVIHIGDCGVHANRCETHDAAASAIELIEQHKSEFFPSKLTLDSVSRRSLKPSKPNGGWGDLRDHALCLLNSQRAYSFSPQLKRINRLSNEDGSEVNPLSFNNIVAILD